MGGMKNNRRITFIIVDIIILMVTCMIFFSYYWGKQQTRYFLFSVVALSAVVFLLDILKNNYKIPFSFMITIVSSVVYSLVFMNNIPSLIIFITSLMFALYMYVQGLDKTNIKLLFFCCLLLSIQAIYMSTLPSSRFSFSNALVLAFDNPNMAGIILSNIVIILIIGIFYFKRPSARICLALISIVMCYLVVLTNNRGSLLTLIVFALLIVLSRRGKMINNKVRIVLILFPFIFIIIYFILLNFVPYDAILFNKPFFSGRQVMWKYTIDKIISDPLSISSYRSGGANLLLSSFYQFGVIAVMSYFVFILGMKPKFCLTGKLTFQQVAYMGFLCIYLQQAFESTLISGSYTIYIFSYILLGISTHISKEEMIE